MAHDVTLRLQVHQAVHGYAQGHQQLALSVQLRPRDTKAMLVFSDISGPGVRPGEDGYLTGYPLPDSKYYVIARTWAAPEMPRPGCVWTHSLLIDFADLATLSDPNVLLSLFRRPEAGIFRECDRAISFEAESSAQPLPLIALDFARKALAALYDRPRSRVIGARPQGFKPDDVVIALWSQQWPRLRRAFRFCTQVGVDRSNDLGQFDMQLYTATESGSRSRFPDAIDLDDMDSLSEDWIEDSVADLTAPNASDFRNFMRNIGGDIDSGREAFRPLCRLHVQLQRFHQDPDAVGSAIALLEEDLGSIHAGTARALVTAEAAKLPQLGDEAFDFVLRHLELVDPSTLANYGHGLGRQIWARSPQRLSEMLSGTVQEQAVAQATLSELTSDDYLMAIERSPEFVRFALAQRPGLMSDARFWALRSVPVDTAFAAVASDLALQAQVLDMLIENDRDDLIPAAVRVIGSASILRLLASRWSGAKRRDQALIPWLRATARDLSVVAEFLSNGPAPREMLLALAHQLTPDAVPNDYGTDPWLIAFGEAPESKPSAEHLYLNAFIFTRALGWRSHNQADLAHLSFEALHSALAHDRLPDESWQLLDLRLPWVFSRLSLDRCLRLRKAVVDLFVDRNLSSAQFAQLSDDDEVFTQLTEVAAHSYRGRKFLGTVRSELERGGALSRIRLIDKLIGEERS